MRWNKVAVWILAGAALPVHAHAITTPTASSVARCAVALDDSLILGGEFEGSLRLGKRSFKSRDHGVFLAREDAKQSVAWGRVLDGAGDDAIHAVTLDGAGVIVAGMASDGTDFGAGPVTGFGARSAFLARYLANGELEWVHHLPANGSIDSLALAENGDIFVGGCFSGASYDLGAGQMLNAFRSPLRPALRAIPPLLDSEQTDGFVARLRRGDGSAVWSRRFGGSAPDCVRSVAADSLGGVYLGMVIYGPARGEPEGVNAGGSNMVIAKLDAQNGELVWHFANRDQYDLPRLNFRIAVDGSAVYFAGSAELLPHIGNLSFKRGLDGFAGSLDSGDGSVRWLRTLPLDHPWGPILLSLGSSQNLTVALRGTQESSPAVAQHANAKLDPQRDSTWLFTLRRDDGNGAQPAELWPTSHGDRARQRKAESPAAWALGPLTSGGNFWAGSERDKFASGSLPE